MRLTTKYALFAFVATLFLYGYLKLDLIATIAYIVLFTILSFLLYYFGASYHLVQIINKHCDPLRHNNRVLSLQKSFYPSFQDEFRVYYAVGLSTLGEFEKSKEVLYQINLDKYKKVKFFNAMYYINLVSNHLYLGELSIAEQLFQDHLSDLNINHKGVLLALKITSAEFSFYREDYSTSRQILSELLSQKLNNYSRINCTFLLAQIDEKEGKLSEAVEKYQLVADQGNTLYFAKLSKEKIQMLQP